jgi:hypothetical protein
MPFYIERPQDELGNVSATIEYGGPNGTEMWAIIEGTIDDENHFITVATPGGVLEPGEKILAEYFVECDRKVALAYLAYRHTLRPAVLLGW